MAETSAGLQVRRGLFELSTQTITLARVQGVVLSEPWMWRPFGWTRLDVSIAGYAGSDGDGGPSVSTVMPAARKPVVLALARRLLAGSVPPDEADPEEVPLTSPPRRARWVAPVFYRYLAVGLGERLAVSREGLLTRRTHVVPHARVQSLRLRQGPWQRRFALADVVVDSPPGPVHVRARHRPVAEARAILEEEDRRARDARRARDGRRDEDGRRAGDGRRSEMETAVSETSATRPR